MSKGLLKAQRFDSRRMKLDGAATAIGSDEPVIAGEYTGGRAVSASDAGTLVYFSASHQDTRLVWFDNASGKEVGTVAMPPGQYDGVRIAPDHRHAAVERWVSTSQSDIWIVDLENGGGVPLTSGLGFKSQPHWSHDGKRIVFSSNRNGGDFFVKSISDTIPEQPLHAPWNVFTQLDDWSPDDQFILFERLDSTTRDDLWILPLDGASPPRPYLTNPSNERDGSFSPHGGWVSYISDEGGTPDLYIQSFPTPGESRRVTTNEGLLVGGWTVAGQIGYMRAKDRQLFSVEVDEGPPLIIGTRRTLTTFPIDVTSGDNRGPQTLAIRPLRESAPASLTVVYNWAAALPIR
jgi:hypothetical protein